MNLSSIIGTNLVIALCINRSTIGAARQGQHVHKITLCRQGGCLKVHIKRPDFLYAGVRVRQVHGLVVWAERHAIGGDQTVYFGRT